MQQQTPETARVMECVTAASAAGAAAAAVRVTRQTWTEADAVVRVVRVVPGVAPMHELWFRCRQVTNAPPAAEVERTGAVETVDTAERDRR